MRARRGQTDRAVVRHAHARAPTAVDWRLSDAGRLESPAWGVGRLVPERLAGRPFRVRPGEARPPMLEYCWGATIRQVVDRLRNVSAPLGASPEAARAGRRRCCRPDRHRLRRNGSDRAGIASMALRPLPARKLPRSAQSAAAQPARSSLRCEGLETAGRRRDSAEILPGPGATRGRGDRR